MEEWLHHLDKALLKPVQKMDIPNRHHPYTNILGRPQGCKAGLLESPDLQIQSTVKEWLHLTPCTRDAVLYSSMKDGGLGITKLMGLNPSIQARRLRRLAQLSDDALRSFLKEECSDQIYRKLWITAGGDKEKILSIWEPKLKTELLDGAGDDTTSEWEVATLKAQYL